MEKNHSKSPHLIFSFKEQRQLLEEFVRIKRNICISSVLYGSLYVYTMLCLRKFGQEEKITTCILSNNLKKEQLY